MRSRIELLKPRDFGEIINDTFIFVRQNFKPLMKYFFIFCGIFILAAAASSIANYIKTINAASHYNPNSFDSQYRTSPWSVFNLGYFINLLFLILEDAAISVTVLSYITLYKLKQNNIPDTEEMWGYFKYFYLRILGSSFLLLILLLLGLVFCLIPGIYLFTIFALVAPIMVIENASFGYAFNQSFRLIKNNWWVTFGALVIILIVIYVASIAVVFPAVIINSANIYSHFLKTDTARIAAKVLTVFLQQVSHVFYILMTVATSLCYFNLVESKEGTGLMDRINQFGNVKPDADITPEEY